MKYRNFTKFTLLALLAFAFQSTASAQTRIVEFDFSDNTSLNEDGAEAAGEFDGAGVGDTFAVDGVTFTVLELGSTLFQVTGVDPIFGTQVAPVPGQTAPTTVTTGFSGIGLDNESIAADTQLSAQGVADDGFINADEFITFAFDTDVLFTSLDFDNINPDETAIFTIDGVDTVFGDGATSDTFANPFGDAFLIAADTAITLTGGPSTDDRDTAFTLRRFSVEVAGAAAVPEPSSLALLALGGVVTIARRRRG